MLLRPVQRQIEFGQPRRGELDGLPALQDRLDQLRAQEGETNKSANVAPGNAVTLSQLLKRSGAAGGELLKPCAPPRKIIVNEKTIIVKLQRGALLGGDVPSSASADGCDSAIELTAAVAFTRRGAETKLVLPGLAQQKHNSRCDPALIKAILDELANQLCSFVG